MTAAGRGLATVQVTEAVRDAKIGGKKVKKGQTIALDPDDGLVAVDGDRDEGGPRRPSTRSRRGRADHALLRRRRDPRRGRGDRRAGSASTCARAAEVEVVHGGQPHYRYLISAE